MQMPLSRVFAAPSVEGLATVINALAAGDTAAASAVQDLEAEVRVYWLSVSCSHCVSC